MHPTTLVPMTSTLDNSSNSKRSNKSLSSSSYNSKPCRHLLHLNSGLLRLLSKPQLNSSNNMLLHRQSKHLHNSSKSLEKIKVFPLVVVQDRE
jgi:hypothetical protein